MVYETGARESGDDGTDVDSKGMRHPCRTSGTSSEVPVLSGRDPSRPESDVNLGPESPGVAGAGAGVSDE